MRACALCRISRGQAIKQRIVLFIMSSFPLSVVSIDKTNLCPQTQTDDKVGRNDINHERSDHSAGKSFCSLRNKKLPNLHFTYDKQPFFSI